MYEHLAAQAQKAMFALKEKVKSTVGYLTPNLSLKMFDTHILPILEYNSEIWFPLKEIDALEKIQTKYLKNMLGVRSQTPTVAVLADAGRFPLLVRQHEAAIKYLHRLRSNACPPLLYDCYKIQTELTNRNKPCWLSRLDTVTNSLEVNLENCTLNKTISALYERIQTKIFTEINDSTQNPKLRTYKTFKLDVRIEQYLNHDLPKAVSCSIACLGSAHTI